tara:strand:- start:42 stop:266 length:225 start_codon:yes stop_codon:yes gene_type:complete
MQPKQWNEIQEVFVDTFGWEDGIKKMLDASWDIKRGKMVYEMSEREDSLLIKHLRNVYNKEKKWLEKEKVKLKK